MKPIHILLYEDKKVYADSFKLTAQRKRIIVDAVDNVDEFLELLEVNHRKYSFLILDARAYLHEGQAEGTENEANLIKLFREIDIINIKKGKQIPYCINTGFADIKIRHNEVVNCPIFEKGQEEELFTYIWESFNKSDLTKLRQDYPGVFEFADTHFDEVSSVLLFSLLHKKKFESDSISDRVTNLAHLRRLMEHTTDIIFEKYLNRQAGIIRNRATRTNDVFYHLNNSELVPSHIFGPVINISKTASNFGSHTPEQAAGIEDYPTKNTIIGLTFGFFDIISWTHKILS